MGRTKGFLNVKGTYVIITGREGVKGMHIPYSHINLFFVPTAQSATYTHRTLHGSLPAFCQSAVLALFIC